MICNFVHNLKCCLHRVIGAFSNFQLTSESNFCFDLVSDLFTLSDCEPPFADSHCEVTLDLVIHF